MSHFVSLTEPFWWGIPAWDQRLNRIEHMAEHKHGSMDTSAQEKTFEGFINATVRVTVVILVVAVLLAIFRT